MGGSLLLVEDDARTADTIRQLLTAVGHDDVVVAPTCRDATLALRAATPDLILLDLGLPDQDGVDFLTALRAGAFAVAFTGPVLVLTSATSADRILAALHAGADGYLFKDDIDLRLAGALRDLLDGGTPLSATAAKVVVESLRRQAPARHAPRLSPKELRVLEGLSTGASYSEIGEQLKIELNTVRSHVRSVYEKLGVENRAEAVNLGWSYGLLRSGS
jgi:DNA-binding NarL/FixJ family response regulator